MSLFGEEAFDLKAEVDNLREDPDDTSPQSMLIHNALDATNMESIERRIRDPHALSEHTTYTTLRDLCRSAKRTSAHPKQAELVDITMTTVDHVEFITGAQRAEYAQKIVIFIGILLRAFHLQLKGARIDTSAKSRVRFQDPQDSELFDQLTTVLSGLSRILKHPFRPNEIEYPQAFADLYMEPLFRFLELNDIFMDPVLNVLAVAVRAQHQQDVVRDRLVTLIKFYDTKAAKVGQFVVSMYKRGLVDFADTFYRKVCIQEFETDNSRDEKGFSLILELICAELPQLCADNFKLTCELLDSRSRTIRSSGVHCLTKAVLLLSDEANGVESSAKIKRGVELLEKHQHDEWHIARSRVVKACGQILKKMVDAISQHELNGYFNTFTNIAAERTRDKSVAIRKAAFDLMSNLLEHNWYSQNEIPLEIEACDRGLKQLDEEIQSFRNEHPELDQSSSGGESSEDPNEIQVDRQRLVLLQMREKMWSDAKDFIVKVNEAISWASKLLKSKRKADIMTAMQFFVTVDSFVIPIPRETIRALTHLVWTRGGGGENKEVIQELIKTFNMLYFTFDSSASEGTIGVRVAYNLMILTEDATINDLNSLEKLLVLGQESDDSDPSPMTIFRFSETTIMSLWEIYRNTDAEKRVTIQQREAAAVVLSMLSINHPDVANVGYQDLLDIGFGVHALQSYKLAKYTCRVVQSLSKREIRKLFQEPIITLLLKPAKSLEWFGFATEALRALNAISSVEKGIFAQVISRFVEQVYDKSTDYSEQDRQDLFAQLLFVVGESIIKVLLYLDQCNTQFSQSNQGKTRAVEGDDLAQAVASTSDVAMTRFTNLMNIVRDEDLLFNPSSIFAPFTRILPSLIMEDLTREADNSVKGETFSRMLQIAASTAFVKFMCASYTFCDENVERLYALITKSRDDAIRSGLLIALGDLNILFNQVTEKYMDPLFTSLNDESLIVKRTCVVNLTFLIMGDKIKIKGSLGMMAQCLVSEDDKIVSLAKVFFNEFASKDNAIFNHISDILGSIYRSSLTLNELKKVVPFIAEIASQDKVLKESLKGKLIQRLYAKIRWPENEKQWYIYTTVLKKLIPDGDNELKKKITKPFAEVGKSGQENENATRSGDDPDYSDEE